MNSDLEEVADVEVLEPEVPEQFEEIRDLLPRYEQRAAALVPSDELTIKQCALFVKECKLAANRVEEKRKALVDPLNKEVKEHNAVHNPVREAFERLWRGVDNRVALFVEAKRQEQERDQQRLIAEANQKQRLLDQQAEEARKKAAEAAAAGDTKAALKAEAKAEELELKSANVTTEVVTMQSNTIDLGGATLSVKAPKKDWVLPSWDKTAKLYGDDPRLKGVDPAWLLRFCILDPVRLNAAFKSGEKFPSPFGEVNVLGGSTLRTTK